jgi:ATP-dependent Lhr-like helicase
MSGRQPRRRSKTGKNCVIVATSALELGIDIGDLDHVLQIDAPSTVAAFLQRMGRTGRRDGMSAQLHLPRDQSPTACSSAAAIIKLFQPRLRRAAAGRDDARPRTCSHTRSWRSRIQHEGGVPAADWWAWVSAATPFRELTEVDRQELVAHMIAHDIVTEADGRFVLGARGEKLYGWRNFAELYAVFSTPQTLKVLWGTSEIGTIDALFAQQGKLDELSFVLGARAWRAVAIDWNEGFVRVEPMTASGLARWQGSPRLLGAELCQAIRSLLVEDGVDAEWSQRARTKLAELRAEYALVPDAPTELVSDGRGLRLWTFAGGKANNLLAKALGELLGDKVVVDNLYIGFRDDAARSEVAIRQALAQLGAERRPDHADALRFAESCGRGRLSKFQPCLPPRLEAEYLASMLTDEVGARAIVTACD